MVERTTKAEVVKAVLGMAPFVGDAEDKATDKTNVRAGRLTSWRTVATTTALHPALHQPLPVASRCHPAPRRLDRRSTRQRAR